MSDTGSSTVTYEAVRKATGGEAFTISLTNSDEVKAVVQALNQKIDAHLEACYCSDRGDRYDGCNRMAGVWLAREGGGWAAADAGATIEVPTAGPSERTVPLR